MSYALVTGGSRGIGRACCVKLAEMGYNIIINYTANEAEALKTAEAVKAKGVEAVLMRFDVSKMEEVDANVGKWIETQKDKPITVLVNNAGINKDNLMVLMD